MDLKGLSKDSAVAILEELVNEGIIQKEKVTSFLQRNPSNDMKRATDLIHRTLCQEVHSGDEDYCQYDLEEVHDTCWNAAYHQLWLRKTFNLMQELEVSNEDELLKVFETASVAVARLTTIALERPKSYKMVLKMLRLKEEKNDV